MYPSRIFFIDKLVLNGLPRISCASPSLYRQLGPTRLNCREARQSRYPGRDRCLAALSAKGESTIRNVGQIDRGYERIDEKLQQLGADIVRKRLLWPQQINSQYCSTKKRYRGSFCFIFASYAPWATARIDLLIFNMVHVNAPTWRWIFYRLWHSACGNTLHAEFPCPFLFSSCLLWQRFVSSILFCNFVEDRGTIRQGPHHGAQKSTITGRVFSKTVFSKAASVTLNRFLQNIFISPINSVVYYL